MMFETSKHVPKKICELTGRKSCFYIDGDTELTRAADVMMSRAKRIYILIIKVYKPSCFPFSHHELENMYSVFPSSIILQPKLFSNFDWFSPMIYQDRCIIDVIITKFLPLPF